MRFFEVPGSRHRPAVGHARRSARCATQGPHGRISERRPRSVRNAPARCGCRSPLIGRIGPTASETVGLLLTTNEDAYVTVLDIGPTGRVTQLFPNPYQPGEGRQKAAHQPPNMRIRSKLTSISRHASYFEAGRRNGWQMCTALVAASAAT